MNPEILVKALSEASGLIVIPWIVWVTASIFTQRQEIALLRQIVCDLRELLNKRF